MAEETRLIREVRQRPEGGGWGQQARIVAVPLSAKLPAGAMEIPAGVSETDWKDAADVPSVPTENVPSAPVEGNH